MPRGIFLHTRDTKEKSPGARATGPSLLRVHGDTDRSLYIISTSKGLTRSPSTRFSSSSAAPIDWRYLLVSAAQKEKPRSGNRGFISWRVHGTGVAPCVFSLDINPTQAISGRSSGSRIFSPPATNLGYVRNRPSFWGIYSKPVPSASLSRYSVGPALSGDFRGLYFSLQHDVWSRTMKVLFVLLCPTAAGRRLGLWWMAEGGSSLPHRPCMWRRTYARHCAARDRIDRKLGYWI